MIVVDTNVIANLLLNGSLVKEASNVWEKDSEWAVPKLWRSEFRNVLALYLRKEIINFEELIFALDSAERKLNLREYEVHSLKVMEFVRDSKCSAYDCEFVVLAKELGTKLVTGDKQILKSFPNLTISLKTF